MLIDKITEKQQKDVLNYIRSLYEPREHPRSSQRLEIDSVIGDRVIQSDTRDIRAGEHLLNFTNASLEPDSVARVVFSIPGQGRPVKLNSKVVRTEEKGVAFQFNKMANYSHQILAEVLSGSGEGD
jgi:hypothetical protein